MSLEETEAMQSLPFTSLNDEGRGRPKTKKGNNLAIITLCI